jgi:hypothetical protein
MIRCYLAGESRRSLERMMLRYVMLHMSGVSFGAIGARVIILHL